MELLTWCCLEGPGCGFPGGDWVQGGALERESGGESRGDHAAAARDEVGVGTGTGERGLGGGHGPCAGNPGKSIEGVWGCRSGVGDFKGLGGQEEMRKGDYLVVVKVLGIGNWFERGGWGRGRMKVGGRKEESN